MSSALPTLSRRTTIGLAAAAAAGLLPRRARAATRIRVLTNFFAEPSAGGYFQAKATGLYEKAGLDVQVHPGGPQINGMQLLLGGETDKLMSGAFTILDSLARGAPVLCVATAYQFELQCVVTHADVTALPQLKGHQIEVSAQGHSSYWPWLKLKYGFTDDQTLPYSGNFQQFLVDDNVAVGGIISSEPYRISRAGAKINTFLLADAGFPPYGAPIVAMRPFVEQNREAVAAFVKATLEGYRSFLHDPAPGSALIKQMNPQADDGWIGYAVDTLRRLHALDSGDAKTMGIGIMTEARWQSLAELMVSTGLLKAGTDWRAAYTTEFVRDLHLSL